MYGKQQLAKLTEVAKNFYLEAQKLLRISHIRLESCQPGCYDFENLRLRGSKMELLIKKMRSTSGHSILF